jgi:hypothetical protein
VQEPKRGKDPGPEARADANAGDRSAMTAFPVKRNRLAVTSVWQAHIGARPSRIYQISHRLVVIGNLVALAQEEAEESRAKAIEDELDT